MRKLIKKIHTIITILSILVLLSSSCQNSKQNESNDGINDWDMSAIGFFETTLEDMHLLENKVKVAIVDSGNNNEYPNIENGYNVIDNSFNTEDQIGHGTLITFKLNQLCPNLTIIPIKVTNEKDNVLVKNFVDGIKKAIEYNVDVINISMGISSDHSEIQEVIKEANTKGIVVVASAGNQGKSSLDYPAAYDDVISVIARSDSNIDLSTNNKSKTKKSFSAPGINVPIGKGKMSGCSIATIYVTALVSTLKSIDYSLTNDDIQKILIGSSAFYTDYSYGMINFERAIAMLR